MSLIHKGNRIVTIPKCTAFKCSDGGQVSLQLDDRDAVFGKLISNVESSYGLVDFGSKVCHIRIFG